MAQLAPLLLISVVVVGLFAAANKVRSQDTSFAFDSFSTPPADGIFYQGNIFIPINTGMVHLGRGDRETPMQYSAGQVYHDFPVNFWDTGRQASFETTIRLFIASMNDNPGDGVAFYISPFGTRVPGGSTGGRLGLFNASSVSSSLFAVEFDTYPNADLGDPPYPHIGIDINSLFSRNVTRFDTRRGGLTTVVHITYDAPTRLITVVAVGELDTYTLTYEFDLKTILPKQVQVGISGSTGGSFEFQAVQAWSFRSTMGPDPDTTVINAQYA